MRDGIVALIGLHKGPDRCCPSKHRHPFDWDKRGAAASFRLFPLLVSSSVQLDHILIGTQPTTANLVLLPAPPKQGGPNLFITRNVRNSCNPSPYHLRGIRLQNFLSADSWRQPWASDMSSFVLLLLRFCYFRRVRGVLAWRKFLFFELPHGCSLRNSAIAAAIHGAHFWFGHSGQLLELGGLFGCA